MRKTWIFLLLLVVSAAVPFLAGTRPGLEGYPTLAPAWSQQITPPVRGEEIDDFWFGTELSPSGDVNADGHDDMVVLSSLSIISTADPLMGLLPPPQSSGNRGAFVLPR